MSLGEFPLPKTCQKRQRREKNALGPTGEKKREKKCHLEKKVFGWLEKQNVGWKKNLSVEKKMSVGEFPLPKTDMSGMSGIPWNATPKNGRGGKKPPRAYREGKKS